MNHVGVCPPCLYFPCLLSSNTDRRRIDLDDYRVTNEHLPLATLVPNAIESLQLDKEYYMMASAT